MMRMDFNHCRAIEETLAGKKAVDEQTFASLAILSERLARLKKIDGMFEKVEFSDAVKKLAEQKTSAAVC